MSPVGAGITLSVVVVSFSSPALLKRCLASLERQTIQEGVEVLVVRRREDEPFARQDLERRFGHVHWVHAPNGSNVPQMRRLGMIHSRGKIIALLEDDCAPTQTWQLELIKSHETTSAAIGGAVEPSRYTKALDWAVYLLEYGRFMQPLPAGEVQALPGTNVSYKRSAIMPFLGDDQPVEEDLSRRGFYEVFVHQELQKSGQVLRADPQLEVYNANSWDYSQVLGRSFHHGRGFAGMRVAGRKLWGRLPFLGLAACLPLLQVFRLLARVIERRRYALRSARVLPWIILISISWSLGEFVGYLRGPGNSLQKWC